MTALVPISLIGWLPIVLVMFLILPPRRAVVLAFIAAWLFLPVNEDVLAEKGLPAYNKMTATCLGVLLGTLVFDNARLLSFRPKWYDLPILIWCLCPIASSLANSDGIPTNPLYDGLAEALKQTVTWGLAYLIGRIYFTNLAALRDLAIGILIGGLIYIPLCLFELKMSPQLHYLVYGSHPHADFRQAMRGEGFRPTVFMGHGLMVASWMTSATLIGGWLWFTGALRRLRGIHPVWLVPPLFLVALASKSLASALLLFMGLGALFFAARRQIAWPIVLMITVAPVYMGLRATGAWDGMNLVNLAEGTVGEKRAQSLYTRFSNENLLTEKAFERPVFGWAGWGRSRVYDRHGKDISITDGQWVIALGKNGLVGLTCLTLTILLPVWLTLKRFPVRVWTHPQVAAAAVLAVVLILYMIDNLLNAMINPVFMLVAGALAGQSAPAIGAAAARRRARRAASRNTSRRKTHPGHAAAQAH